MEFTPEERETIAAENIKLVHFVVNKYKGTKLDESELESIALVGFTKALNWFDSSKGMKFSTYVVDVMRWEIAAYMKEEYKKRGVRDSMNLDYVLPSRGSESTAMHELIGDKQSQYELFDVIHCIEKVITKLDEDEKNILLLIIEGNNQREITRIIGNRSRTWVWSKMQNIRKLLNYELGNVGC